MATDPSAIVPRPPKADHDRISPWLDERIWGHRIFGSQSPWLIFLEFLTVAEACNRSNKLLDEQGKYYPTTFRPFQRMYVRNILFNNEAIARINEQNRDSDTAWTVWLNWIHDRAQAVPNRDFTYLKTRFHSFDNFTSLVMMLRSSAVESNSNKRWTSRFVFPFGPNGIYEDLNVVNGNTSREYINFGRTGEILYLMLARSSSRDGLASYLARIMGDDNKWNALLGILQPGEDVDQPLRGNSYLPYVAHPRFDELGLDWLAVFERNLPGFDSYLHLVLLGSLHILLYHLEVAAEWARPNYRPYLICEMVAPRKTFVRELSFSNYMDNNSLSAQAIKSYIDNIEASDEWKEALKGYDTFTKCKQILEERVWWPKSKDDYSGPADSDWLIRELRTTAAKRHQQHVAIVHRSYGREIGLISKRGTNRLRYAPNDALLKSLVLANVKTRMEFHEFLAVLYNRYGLVFGDREADLVLPDGDLDKKAFQANARRLEQRLSSLGMLKRLSDACAYVENPYDRRSE